MNTVSIVICKSTLVIIRSRLIVLFNKTKQEPEAQFKLSDIALESIKEYKVWKSCSHKMDPLKQL